MREKRARDWLKDSFILFFLVGLVLIKFWDFLVPGDKLFWGGDFIEITSPRNFFYQNLRKGFLILWDTHIGAGMPYLAEDYGVFYPIDLLMGILYPDYFDPYRLSVIHALHFWLAGVFMYLYTRQLNFSRIPALLSSICFMLGGFLMGHAGQRNVVETYIWLPLILTFLDKALLQRRMVWAVLAGLFLAVSFLAGHPNFFYFILLFVAFYFLFSLVQGIRDKAWKKMAWDTSCFLVFGLICLGVSAIQLLPLLSTSLNTHHGALPFEWKAVYPFPLFNLAHLVIPGVTQWTATDIGEQYGYIGFLPLLFAGWAIFQWKDIRVRFLGLVVLFSFIASLGDLTPLYRLLYDHLPGLDQFRIPARFNTLIIFPLAVLAGFGFQRFFGEGNREEIQKRLKSIKRLLAGSLGCGFLILIWVGFSLPPLEQGTGLLGPWIKLKGAFIGFLLIWGASYILISLRNRNFSLRWSKVFLVLLISLDLLFLGRLDGNYSRNNPTALSPQAQEVIREIKKDPSLYRISNIDRWLSPFWCYQEGLSAYDLENLLGYVNTVVPKDYLELLFRVEQNPKLLDLLNVKYLIGTNPRYPKGPEWFKIGGTFDDKELELNCPASISELTVTSFLSHSQAIPQGQPVARITFTGKDGSAQEVLIRAGIETSEWAVDRPGLYCSHQKARVVDSWDIPGEGYQGHAYVFSARLSGPKEISKIGLQYLAPQGRLLIKKILVNQQDIQGLLKNYFQPLAPNVYYNSSFFPRAFMIARAKVFPSEKELLEQLEQLDPRKTILISRYPDGYKEPPEPSFSRDEAKIMQYSPHQIKISTKTDQNKFLVLSDTYQSSWKAWIDQSPSPILKVNYGLRGLYVPKGEHQIELSFRFYPFYLGLAITLISLAAIILITYGALKRKASGSRGGSNDQV